MTKRITMPVQEEQQGDLLYQEVCDHPAEFDRYLVLADWCEDNQLGLQAECWRLLGLHGKRPYLSEERDTEADKIILVSHWWIHHPDDGHKYAHLTPLWLKNIWGTHTLDWREHGNDMSKGFDSVDEAFRAAILAYTYEMKERQRKHCRRWIESGRVPR